MESSAVSQYADFYPSLHPAKEDLFHTSPRMKGTGPAQASPPQGLSKCWRSACSTGEYLLPLALGLPAVFSK